MRLRRWRRPAELVSDREQNTITPADRVSDAVVNHYPVAPPPTTSPKPRPPELVRVESLGGQRYRLMLREGFRGAVRGRAVEGEPRSERPERSLRGAKSGSSTSSVWSSVTSTGPMHHVFIHALIRVTASE